MPFSFEISSPLPRGVPVLPHPWQMWPSDAASPVMAEYLDLHRLMLFVLGAVLLAFFVLLGLILHRFSARRHPRPHKASGPFLQFAWVGLPVVLLVLIAIPALRLNAYALTVPKADVTVMAVGEDGLWRYAYPNDGNFSFPSRMLDRAGASKRHQPYGFAVDAPLVVPAGRTVEVRLTSADVMHSWAVPALGVRREAVPGQITHLWFKAQKPGIYYGLCAFLCGSGSRAMPVAVRAVPEESYRKWLSWALHHYAPEGGEKVVPSGNAP